MKEHDQIKDLQARINQLEDENTRLRILVEDLKGALEDDSDHLEKERVKLRLSLVATIQALARAIEAKDPFTQGHSELVSKFAMAVAHEIGLPWDQVERIQMAGMLLDVGKIGVPQEILLQPSELSAQEAEIMRKHVEISAKILEPIIYPWSISTFVYQHHERLDGSGYPRGLSGEEISMEAKILGLVDSFVAMSNDRAYRKAHSRSDVLDYLKDNSGKLFDSEVVEAFLAIIGRGEEAIFSEVESLGKWRESDSSRDQG